MFAEKEKFKEPELRWQIFYTSFLQVNPENYSLEEALKLSIPYIEYILYYNNKAITNKNKCLIFLFDQLLKYEKINKIVNFNVIEKTIKNMGNGKSLSGYFYDELKTDIKFLETEVCFYYKNCVINDENRKLSEWNNKTTYEKSYQLFINALVEYYEILNEKDIFKMSSDFLKLLKEKEKDKLEILEKDFNRFFNKTLLENVYE